MSNPFHGAVDDALRGEHVHVRANDGTRYYGIVERIHHHDRHVLLRGAKRFDFGQGDDQGGEWTSVGAVMAAHSQAIEQTAPERVESVPLDAIGPAPWAVREFDRQANREYIQHVRSRGWVESFPTVRPVGDHRYQTVDGHKRLWVAQQAGLDRHPVEIVDVGQERAFEAFIEAHIPPVEDLTGDGQRADGWYTDAEIETFLELARDRLGTKSLVDDHPRVRANEQRLGVDSDDSAGDPADGSTERTVLVAPSKSRKSSKTYHVDRDCRYVKQMSNVLERHLSVLPPDFEPCSHCVESAEAELNEAVTDGGLQAIAVEGPIPEECTTQTCTGDPEWAVRFEDGVSRVMERDHDEGPPDGAVCPYVCEDCRRERYDHIDDDRWTPVVEVATDGGRPTYCSSCMEDFGTPEAFADHVEDEHEDVNVSVGWILGYNALVTPPSSSTVHAAVVDAEDRRIREIMCGQTLPPESGWTAVSRSALDEYGDRYTPCSKCNLHTVDGIHPTIRRVELTEPEAYPIEEMRVVTDGGRRETHLDEDGLWIPPEFREFDSQIVIRTPRSTIHHFGSQPLDPYYGMVTERDFGDPDAMRDPRNPDLAPDQVSIKKQGEPAVTLDVDLDATLVADGGHPPDDQPPVREEYPEFQACPRCRGTGERVECMDDLCHANGRCMHESANNVCNLCAGTGDITRTLEERWYSRESFESVLATAADLKRRGQLHAVARKRREEGQIPIADGGYYPDHPLRDRDSHHLDPPTHDIRDVCADCGEAPVSGMCGCCHRGLCGRHAETGGGFCGDFTYIAGQIPACVTSAWITVGHRLVGYPDDSDEPAVLVSRPGNVYHLPAPDDPEAPTEYDVANGPLCRPAEREHKAIVDLSVATLDEDRRLCKLCEDRYLSLQPTCEHCGRRHDTVAAAADCWCQDFREADDSGESDESDDPSVMTDGGQTPEQQDADALVSAGMSHAAHVPRLSPLVMMLSGNLLVVAAVGQGASLERHALAWIGMGAILSGGILYGMNAHRRFVEYVIDIAGGNGGDGDV